MLRHPSSSSAVPAQEQPPRTQTTTSRAIWKIPWHPTSNGFDAKGRAPPTATTERRNDAGRKSGQGYEPNGRIDVHVHPDPYHVVPFLPTHINTAIATAETIESTSDIVPTVTDATTAKRKASTATSR